MMKQIYLDHMATTPPRREVIDAMRPYLEEAWGNPQSTHSLGQRAKVAIEEARGKVAALIGAEVGEIFFTSSGTEANNLALKGITLANQKRGRHIITSVIEHPSVLHCCRSLEKEGFRVTELPVDRYGRVDPRDVAAAITPETTLVSIQHASNEIGTIQPLADIGRIVQERGISFHTDAIAATGTIPVDIARLGVDALSLTAHMFYGPKGAGALCVRKGVRVRPFIEGGIQEEGRRAGTEDVPAVVGLGRAAELASKEIPLWNARLLPLRDRLIQGMREITGLHLTGHPTERLPGHVSVYIEEVEGETLLRCLNQEGIFVGSGSACTSRASKASHVLSALGIESRLAQGSLIVSMGRETTAEEINDVLSILPPLVEKHRRLSPLYTPAVKEGRS